MIDHAPSPEHVRRQVLRRARYGLNVLALRNDALPPEGPFDVALTNGLLAVVAEKDPGAVTNASGWLLPASKLLPIAEKMGFPLNRAVLEEGLDITQPMRHGRADDEWISLRGQHLSALEALDDIRGLQVLNVAASNPTLDRLVYVLFSDAAHEILGYGSVSPKDSLELPTPELCDECSRNTFVPFGFDDGGGLNVPGICLACGHQRSEEEASDLYLEAAWERWKDD